MSSGTVAEWFGAIATTAAAIIALYFGLRDHHRIERRQASRQALHDAAADRLLHVQRIQAGRTSEERKPNTGHLDDDIEASRLLAAAAGLGWWRRWRALRIMGKIYSRQTLETAYLDRSHEEPGRTVGALVLDAIEGGKDVNHRKRALRHTATIGRGETKQLRKLARSFRQLTKL